MRSNGNILMRLDWVMILLYFTLVGFGWMSIYSTSFPTDSSVSFISHPVGRQQLFIGLSIVLIVFLFALETKFYERFSSVIYVISIVSLIGLFIFGKTVSGATSWYSFGSFSLQPSEFAKFATALALAKYLSDIQTDIKIIKHQLIAFLIIFLPAILIIPQPDPGSALVYIAFFFVLYREGLSPIWLIFGFTGVLLFVFTLVFSPLIVSVITVILTFLIFLKNSKKKPKKNRYLIMLFTCVAISYSVNYIFEHVFEQRHRDRFNVVLGKKVDNKGIGYNIHQSKITVGSGGWTGKGWLNGSQTKGGFVPEQHTDFVFSTIGEEWGFLGSVIVIILFVFLMIRILIKSEKQKSKFNRIYGYSVSAILFIHFAVNIGMVLGIFPTVGIPLPFFSYGGSGLWGFTILLFIFIKLDANRINEW